ncbi:hypothetical protein DFA_08263 [Cavenderia fasciculata]|uniref:Peptidase S53 activation domain-containing protein n=1 Tax=Cavenderia fasciculata TaxID=261658 RepID=F4Q5L2_CACFS|nr:uncharacterized protein DFA_08263 [Cavenderia fasciculata]EGG17271.1 hypothetical protein DFA_08263 [Cavenderia fasciculata]|eukprot:XP_004355755.1 hypothetical protein DFA_08263 [Cavenderia fasciculata]
MSTLNIPTTHLNRIPHFARYTKDLGKADLKSNIHFTIVLKLRNKEWLEEQLKNVSDPKSEKYGKLLSQDEVESMTKPSQEHFDKVSNFLKSKGIESTREKDCFKINTSIEKTQELFATQIHKFTQPESKDESDYLFKREGSFTIPNEISDCVDLVVGGRTLINEFYQADIQQPISALFYLIYNKNSTCNEERIEEDEGVEEDVKNEVEVIDYRCSRPTKYLSNI